MCGASIPDWVANEFTNLDEAPEVQSLVGASLASDLVKKLKKEEVNEFHFYTLNKYELTFAVCTRLLSLQNNIKNNNKNKGEARA
jgi:methylenetetrahydrofolate reductase (NADPH)